MKTTEEFGDDKLILAPRKTSDSLQQPLTGRVLVVDDHARARESVADILRHCGHQVQCCSSALEALQVLDHESFDVIITDLRMPGMSGLEFIQALAKRDSEAQVVMVTAYASVATAVEAMRHGAFDYIEKPFNVDQLEQLVTRALRQSDIGGRRSTVPAASSLSTSLLIGSSPAMQLLRDRIAQIAPTNETVLVCGESGFSWQRVGRPRNSRSQSAELSGRACQFELSSPFATTDGKRTLRPRTRRVHQCRRAPCRTV